MSDQNLMKILYGVVFVALALVGLGAIIAVIQSIPISETYTVTP